MRRLALPLVLSLGLLVPTAALAGESSSPPPRPTVAKKVWSSEEVEALRARGLISLVGQESPAEEPTAEQVLPEEISLPPVPRPIRAKDPEWYREQAEKLRAAIEANSAQIRLVFRQLRDARFWEGGINLNQGNIGITPESTIQLLDARNQAELDKIDALWEKARRNEIPPGALR
jgi:hypothetical protein